MCLTRDGKRLSNNGLQYADEDIAHSNYCIVMLTVNFNCLTVNFNKRSKLGNINFINP